MKNTRTIFIKVEKDQYLETRTKEELLNIAYNDKEIIKNLTRYLEQERQANQILESELSSYEDY